MAIDVSINYNGNCREAVMFYVEVFGVSMPKIMTFGQAPSQGGYQPSEEEKDQIMHTEISYGGNTIMFSDVPKGYELVQGNNVTLVLGGEDKAELARLYEGLAKGGTVVMPLQETFWSPLYGMVTDKFGITWQINCSAK